MANSDPSDRFMPHWRDVKKACAILKKDQEVVDDQNCFFEAVKEYDLKIVREFIKQGVDVNQEGSNGETALMWAVRKHDLKRTLVLLKAGADPNRNGLVNRLFVSPSIERSKILLALIEHGLDLKRCLDTEYNLYHYAIDYEDEEIIEILDKHGAKRPEWPLEEEEVPPLDLKTFQSRLVRALKKAWTEVKKERKGEQFCVFGLETDSDCMVLTPVCNTVEQAEIELGDELVEYPELQYFVQGNFALYGAGKEHLDDLELEINRRRVNSRNTNKLMKIFEGALSDLDQKKFFGTGKNRDKVLLVVEIYDASEREQKKINKIVRRLNPKAASKLYFGK